MTMRTPRSLACALALASVVVAGGCGEGSRAPAAGGDSTVREQVAPSAPEDPALDETTAIPDRIAGVQWTGDLDGMIRRRVIRVLTTPSKVNYFVEQGTQRGLIYDTFQLFENDLNTTLKTRNLRVHVAIIPVAHDELIPALLAGRGDIVAAGTLLTDWRRDQVDFSNPSRSNVSSIVVTGAGVAPVPTPQDLSGREVYIRASDVSRAGVEAFNARLKAAGKAPVTIRPAPEVLADEDILEMVNAGLAAVTIVDDYVAEFLQPVFPDLLLNRGAAVRSGMQTGVLVRRNSPQLLEALNGFLARYPEGSLKRNVLLQEYLKNLKHVRNATADKDRERFERTVALFRKYGDQYKLDALLMAAQGYQESRLDNSVKSPVGAIGIMQVMPQTGKELAVGDIRKPENNVHAGVKYVRFMMDQYFANEPMDDLNKGLFTFASYNAGPNRIRDLRVRAGKRGLNPNVWFNNVEVVASESIGRETVQYVANIYKYYLAYTMLTEKREQRERALAAARR